jgi:hypothetical protein
VREEDLRKYVRREVLLTEAAGDMSAGDVKEIWGAFTDIFKVLGVGLKSLINVLTLNFSVIFSRDEAEVQKAFERYKATDDRLTSKYREITGPIINELGPIEPLIFIANPGAYFAYKFATASTENFENSLQFFEDSGIIEPNFIRRYFRGFDDDDVGRGRGRGRGDGRAPSDAVITQLRQISNRLDSVFGRGLNESLVREAKINVSKEEMLQAFRDAPPSAFKVSEEDSKYYIEQKRKEAEKMVQMLSAPTIFLEKLSKAKTLDDVKSATKILKTSSIVVSGIDKLTPESLEISAKKAIDTAKENEVKGKKGSLKELRAELGAEKLDEKGLLDAVKAYQLKNLLGQAMLQAKEQIIPQTEKMRESFKQMFLEGTPLDVLENIDPEGLLTRTVKEGLKKIEEAGKRPST